MSKTVSLITENYGKYNPESIEEYINIGGFTAVKKALSMTSEEIISEAKASKVLGRGGAAYPLGKKWEQAASVPGDNKVVVCNADEGEPCTFKDRSMLQNDPFRLVEGMIISGYTVGAKNGYIYIREEYKNLQKLFKKAIKQAEEKGFLGTNIQGTDFSYNIHIYSGAGAYVCGEGTALIESIEGKSGRPRTKPPYIKQQGLWYEPTCVNNVESLAIGTVLLTHGAAKYTSYGTAECPGTKIISVGGNVKNPGVYEIPFGVTVREIIYDIAGGMTDDKDVNIVQIGGASGKIGDASILDTPFTYDDLHNAGLLIGSGAVLAINADMKPIEFIQSIQEFFCHESCGKCTPCREGNQQIANIIDRFSEGTEKETDYDTMIRVAKIMSTCSFCGLGETAQNALLNAVKFFPTEFGQQ